MEEKIIVAVCGYPELYDPLLYFYIDSYKKDLAWRKVSEEVGQSEEVCRKTWKSLRDTYLKEMEKRSGSAAGSGEKWKYSAVLSFLDPFVSPRETSGNMERGDGAAGYDHTEDQGEAEAAGHSERGGEPTGSCDVSEPGSPLPESAAASVSPTSPSTSAAVSTGPPRRRRAQRRPREQPSEVERELLEILRSRPVAPAPPPRSEEEIFLLSLIPSLQRLPPQTKDYVKFQIHKLIYESSTV